MDELSRFNRDRWEALVAADIEFARPFLDMTPQKARQWLLDEGLLAKGQTDLAGKKVLCLASGGGQQSVGLSLLGAQVTVFDFAAGQLQRDLDAAVHFGYAVRTVQGDMRDLSNFLDNSFDIVWQPYSINFIPNPHLVFAEVARVLRSNGRYRLDFANPYLGGINEEDWNGEGYVLKRPYIDGQELHFDDDHWDITAVDGSQQRVIGPKEFQHSLKSIFNNLADLGFLLRRYWEAPDYGDVNAQPGSWEHFIATAPPWLGVLMIYQPDFVHNSRLGI